MTTRAKAPTFIVLYTDGHEEEAKLLPIQQIAYERDTGEPLFGSDESIQMIKVYTLAWYASGKPDTFDEWVGTLEAVTMVEDGDGDADKGETAPSS